MDKIKKIISAKNLRKISDFLSVAADIVQERKMRNIASEKSIRIAILASSTIRGLEEVLMIKCCELGVFPEIYIGPYKQYAREILDDNSKLYQFVPDLVILFIDTMSVLGDKYFAPYTMSEAKRRSWIDETITEIFSLIETIKTRSAAKIIFHNFEIPIFSPYGIAENRQEFGFIESIETLNVCLRKKYRKDNQVFILEYDAFCSGIGKKNTHNFKLNYMGDIRLDFQFIPNLCDEYIAYIKPMMAINKKCIVLDLDNTLWGGVIGEDGIEGIKLGPTPEGRPFWDFQKVLLSLFNRGIILAVNSKNNPDDVKNVFREHPYMILKEEHFASMQINWNDKVSNMKIIANEINIGLDSLVFFDDDGLNRMLVKEMLPEVLVVDMPNDPALYPKILIEMNDFNVFSITEEDQKKGFMYAQQRKRNELKGTFVDVTQYLKALEMIVTIRKDVSNCIPRVSQLTQKTNQFNMTTRRYSERDIENFSKNNHCVTVSARVEDKYGDNGITGLIIAEKKAEEWRIDSFLMSCRVIGRGVEDAIMAYIAEEAKNEKAKCLIGEFIPTKKNIPARRFYKERGFEMVEENDHMEIWKYDLNNDFKYPDYIKIVKV